ncbi:hypothetical protein GCM10011611_35470 [Aliidongia dinghuensis]|uniref:Uncharacterized protein n=1 Tax=Aliidongia dinghuensis TaxID=1867774 RepID=A0A8J2YWV2_9PROT|nr:hypothetical protein [Aliidongia dinghuensis]GGF26315.1 hypothetical protein GCM10011611_35470 [Aliidongia dinghuensis]
MHFLPHHLADLAALAQMALAFLALCLVGRFVGGRQAQFEIDALAGWGLLAALLTLWGVATTLSLRIPAAAFLAAALVAVIWPGRRPDRAAWGELGRLVVLVLPILAIMATILPSQSDIFMNLMPNAAYLVDHGTFPTAGAPDAHSFLPVAPYNTQLVPFLGSLVIGGFQAGGLALFTICLYLMAALLFARMLVTPIDGADARPETRPGWAATGFGILLVTLLNPGFVPRVAFAGYGEAPVAITLLFAGWLACRAMVAMTAGETGRTSLVQLALVLVALVNVKQQAIGMLIAFALAAILVAGYERQIGWRRAALAFGAAALPAMALYLVWRVFVLTRFPDGELKPLPFDEWNWGNLAPIFVSMGKVVVEKITFFACVAVLFVFLERRLRHRQLDATGKALGLAAATFLLYNGFLVVTYIGHFPGVMSVEAHSFFRYNTHLALLIEFALVVTIRNRLTPWLASCPSLARQAGVAAIVLALLVPVGFAKRLRFDFDQPQPVVRQLALQLAPELKDDDRVALLLPGDTNSVDWMLMSLLHFSAPRRPGLDVKPWDHADQAAFDEAAAEGYGLAFLSCTKGNSLGLPDHASALLRHGADGWEPVKVWPYPPVDPKQRWQPALAPGPLCRS